MSTLREEYSKNVKDCWAVIGLLIVAVIVLLALSLSIGEKFTPLEALQALFDRLTGKVPETYEEMMRMKYVVDENLPRAFAAVCAGAVLAAGGQVLQNVIRNPLADPYTLGISSGALFGMVLAVALGISIIPIATTDGAIPNAFLMALIPTLLVVMISFFRRVSPTTMILIGIAVMYVFNAFTVVIKYTSDNETLSHIYQWAVGSVQGMTPASMGVMLAQLLVVFIPMYYLRNDIDVVAGGDRQAVTLGVDPHRLRIICLVIITLGVSMTVCYTGTIGFVGLVAPHIARMYFGSRCRLLLPASALIGQLMVLGCDCIVRFAVPNLPVGALLALICAPVFVYMLVKMRRSGW